MTKETNHIITELKETLYGQPWYGKPVMKILAGMDPEKVTEKPGGDSHSTIELLYHMITWTGFTVSVLKNEPEKATEFEQLDWRTIEPGKHSWKTALDDFTRMNEAIISFLETKKDDSYLEETVPTRQFNFRVLLNGIIHHHIYHAGQLAHIGKTSG